MFNRLFKGLVDFALPPVCICCEKPLTGEEAFICTRCSSALVKVEDSYSLKQDKFGEADFVNNAFGIYWFREDSNIQAVIHSLKYTQMKSIGRVFGRIIGKEINEKYGDNFDYIVPVPLHKSRLRERTYNQSEYICRGINEILNKRVLGKCLERNRCTSTQTKLNLKQRKENVKNAFTLNKKYKPNIAGNSIILVDDVITTGATIMECARVLHENGANKINVCSIALAELNSSV
jgi:competence protein ComFC